MTVTAEADVPFRRVGRGRGYMVRKLKSGRFQLLVPDPEKPGRMIGMGAYPDPDAADNAGKKVAGERASGTWFDPRAGEVPLADYLTDWLAARQATRRHGERYAQEAARLARLHILPTLGSRNLVDLRPAVIRAWYDALTAKQVRASGSAGLVPAKAYRLLSAALTQATRDELIARNPCQIEGAGAEASPERPLLEPAQIQAVAEAIPDRWHTLIMVAAWCGLRFGEIAGLRRRHIDLLHRRIIVEGSVAQLEDGRLIWKAPKTSAGRRTVSIPDPLLAEIEHHLDTYSEPGPDGYVFVGPLGGVLRRSNFTPVWRKACIRAGVDGATLHDLRHAAGTMAAQTGATVREVQRRLGHASPAAAQRYQHAAERRERDVADKLGAMMPPSTRLAHNSRNRPQPG